MSIERELRSAGGIARCRDLRDRGISSYRVAQAIKQGVVSRPLRGWVALPETDPLLVLAARSRAVVTCVTQAHRLGLWTLTDTVPHLGLHSASAQKPGDAAVVHWALPLLPRPPGSLIDPLENVLAQVAACQPFESAMTVWESAMNRGLVDRSRLALLHWKGAARRIFEECTPFADSGLETLVRTRLRWLNVPMRAQVWLHGHRVDFLIGERLVLQIDGGHHVGAQRTADNRHDAELLLRGYRVIRVTYGQVMERWEEVQELVMGAIARGHHRVA